MSTGTPISRQRTTGIGGQCRIGRSLACDVVIDDAYAAAEHALLTLQEDGRVLVQDLGTLNGTRVDGHRINKETGEIIARGELLIGRTHVRVRTQEGAVAPERAFRRDPLRRHRTVLAVIGLALCFLFAAFFQWTDAPENLGPRVLIAELIALAGLAIWVGVLGVDIAPDRGGMAGANPPVHCGLVRGALGLGILALLGQRVRPAVEMAVGCAGDPGGLHCAGRGIPAFAQCHAFPSPRILIFLALLAPLICGGVW